MGLRSHETKYSTNVTARIQYDESERNADG